MNRWWAGTLLATLVLLSGRADAQTTYVVTNTADSGPGSLRQAILDANAGPECTDAVITFSIGTGPRTIRPISQLPSLRNASIDGSTQPGYAGTPLIEINGDLLPVNSIGLAAGGSACYTIVRALAVNRAPWVGFSLGSPVALLACYAGTDLSGTMALPNSVGVLAGGSGSGAAWIGAATAGDGNLISGNRLYGVQLSNGNTILRGNTIGTDRSGTTAVPNGTGVEVFYVPSAGVVIGTDEPGGGNRISGNPIGIQVDYSNDAEIVGNTIGPGAGPGPAPLQGVGISVYQSTGTTITKNEIAYSSGAGVAVQGTAVRNRISQNSLHDNNAFGIDLGVGTTSGHTPNDPCDADSGENLLMNHPVLLSASSQAGRTVVEGGLESEPNSAYTIELFWSPACHASGWGEGRTYLGSTIVTTDASCQASFTADLPVGVPGGAVVTATATDSYGNTSEFSGCIPVVSSSGFYTLEPCRVLDTRDADGPLGGPALSSYIRRDFHVSGSCGIPSEASVVVANVTATQPLADGALLVFSSATAGGPPVVNFRTGQTRANNAMIALGAGSLAAIETSAGPVHFIVDVVGYFR